MARGTTPAKEDVMTDNPNQQPEEAETPLESWKEISAYVKRAVRTVKRWEQFEGLPVRRHQHQSRSSVYAYPSELDSWLATREPESLREVDAVAPIPSWRTLAALAAVLLLTLVSVGSGPLPTQANAADGPEVVAKRVWAGAGVDNMGSPSRDGKLLSFVDWSTGDLAVRDLEKNVSRRLTNKGTWANNSQYAEFSLISPDAQQVAYAWFNDKFYELRIIGMDGAGQRVLASNPEVYYVQPAGWSPDGKHIYVVLSRVDRTNQIVRVTVADGAVQVLKSFDWRYPHMQLSPDGRFIAYDFPPIEDRGTRDIYLLATDATRELPLVQHASHDFVLGWSPDSASVVFGSDRTGTVSVWSLAVNQGGPPGEAKIVRPNMGSFFPIGLDATGSFYYSMGGSRDVHVAELDPVTGSFAGPSRNAVESFVGTNLGPDFSPDGKYLSYISRRGPPQSGFARVLVIRNLATGEEREIQTKIRLIDNHSWPRWTADGRSLLLWGRDLKGRPGIYLQNLASGEVKTLLQWPVTEIARWPYLSADEKLLYYTTTSEQTNQFNLFRLEVATGTKTQVFNSRHVHAGAFSPDGKTIALSSASEDQKEGAGMANRLLVMPAAGGAPRELRRLPNHLEYKAIVWSPDGRYLYYTEGDNEKDKIGPVWRISTEGGEPQKTTLSLGTRQLQGLRFHPDGKRVAFTVSGETREEIWVLQNFLLQARAAK
jgi:Tol biopolymer transport system component